MSSPLPAASAGLLSCLSLSLALSLVLSVGAPPARAAEPSSGLGRGFRKPRFTPYFVGGALGGASRAETRERERTAESTQEGLFLDADPRKALRQAERLLARDRSRPESWVLVAESALRAGRTRQARNAFQEALRLDASSSRARVGLGRLLVESGQDEERGAQLLRSGLTRTAADAPALGGLALYHKKRGDLTRSRAFYQAGLRLDPVWVEGLHGLALIDLHQGRTAEALERFQRVTRLDPTHSKAWVAQGLIYTRFGEKPRAVAAYARAFNALGGQGAAAREVLDRLRALDPYADPAAFPLPSPPLAASRPPGPAGKTTKPSRDQAPDQVPEDPGEGAAPGAPVGSPAEPAIDLSLDALRRPEEIPPPAPPEGDPADASGRLRRMATLYREEGLYEEAAGALHALIARDPDSAASRQALEELRELRSFHRPDLDQRVGLLRKLADRLRRRRDHRGAREALERILLLQPGDSMTLKDLAFLHARSGDLEEALRLSEESLERTPGRQEAQLVKAYVLARQRKFPQALELYRGVLESEPPEQVQVYARAMVRALEVFAER